MYATSCDQLPARRGPDRQLYNHTAGLTRDAYPQECYHVSWLGVDPAHQGKGLGGAMTRYALQRGKEAGENVRLHTHTQENVSLRRDDWS